MVSHCACPTRVFPDRALHEHRRPSSLPSHSPSKLACFPFSGKGTHVGLRAAVERGPSQGARSGSKEPTWVPFLSLCFRRRPIQLRVPAAVEAREAVTGFASGIWHRGKGDGGVVERARGLFVEEMHFGHHRD